MKQTALRKMLTLAFCLILTSVLAADYGPHNDWRPMNNPSAASYMSAYPNPDDDIYEKVKPKNIIYNFEQIRMDQSPQVEMRDEDIEQYMHRRHTSTTTPAPTPFKSQFEDFPMNVPEYNELQTQARFSEPNRSFENLDRHWNEYHVPTLTRMLPPPPPPNPDWLDLSQDFYRQPYSYQRSLLDSIYPPKSSTEPKPVQSTPASVQIGTESSVGKTRWSDEFKAIQWTDPTKSQDFNWHHNQQTFAQHVVPTFRSRVHQEVTSSVTTVLPNNRSEESSSYVSPQPARSSQDTRSNTAANRGSRKFNWNDLANEYLGPTTQLPSVNKTIITPAVQVRGPPPPVPTLTPWYGNNF